MLINRKNQWHKGCWRFVPLLSIDWTKWQEDNQACTVSYGERRKLKTQPPVIHSKKATASDKKVWLEKMRNQDTERKL